MGEVETVGVGVKEIVGEGVNKTQLEFTFGDEIRKFVIKYLQLTCTTGAKRTANVGVDALELTR